MAESLKTLIRDVRDTVPTGTTKVVDKVPLAVFDALEYTINYKTALPLQIKTLKLLLQKTDTDLATQVFGKSGAALNVLVNAQINGGDAELTITNNELAPLDFVATRLII